MTLQRRFQYPVCMEYRHTQKGRLAMVFGGLLVLYLVIATATRVSTAALVFSALIYVIVGAVALVFSRLTVTVGGGQIVTAFGWGWPKRTIEVLDVTSIQDVRNKWYYGWGIRKVPRGWMYNVWGLDAVELELSSGKTFRIGTDEPRDLMAALSLHTSSRPPQ